MLFLPRGTCWWRACLWCDNLKLGDNKTISEKPSTAKCLARRLAAYKGSAGVADPCVLHFYSETYKDALKGIADVQHA
uniref:Secreted protein n=1 Tax=Heterorhabditis bacteriophora TaxID=37862 RepID=A0A1I7WKH2_HETBA